MEFLPKAKFADVAKLPDNIDFKWKTEGEKLCKKYGLPCEFAFGNFKISEYNKCKNQGYEHACSLKLEAFNESLNKYNHLEGMKAFRTEFDIMKWFVTNKCITL